MDWSISYRMTAIETKDGKRKQHYQYDFCNYFGLARSVWLCCVPETHVNDVTVASEVADGGESGVVSYEISTSQPVPGSRIEVSISDEEGSPVAQACGLSGKLTVNSVKIWKPGAAYLYQLHIRLLDASRGVADVYQLSVGIRSVRVEGNRFLINGKPFYFSGYGKHEDAPVRGKGHDAVYMIHDFELMKWIGANSFRATHYPYAKEVMEYADRHGFVVIGETAAVGLNLAVVAGLHGAKQLPTYSPDTVSEGTRKSHEQAIRELIARDKNHPSPTSPAREHFQPLVALTRQLYSRPLCYANEFQASVDKRLISDLFDVLFLNRYYGWYFHTSDLEAAEKGLETELLRFQAKFGKPIIISEYGADTLAGLPTAGDVPRSEEYQS
ncbi:beta-glucuronidase precursor [Colletotrichum sojae]|uniref:Beta-glucuronidase n=1 Tax=Colletotrichum sojae TaxID=2175907 RepID=A0A8H6MIA0_9PEZI|nr:beta-glucuronidase precursor [Colletotrichum sojae]